jgi:hypothetical protein
VWHGVCHVRAGALAMHEKAGEGPSLFLESRKRDGPSPLDRRHFVELLCPLLPRFAWV